MKLKENEEVVKVLHHHYVALIIRELKIVIVSIPFFFVASLFSTLMNPYQQILMYGAITIVFGLIIAHDGILYHLDRLVITNHRIIYIDWQGIFSRSEHEAELVDIQDIETKETGVLSFIPMFDYGMFTVETASAHTIINFTEAPDPEGIKHFIYHLNVKPNRIGTVGLSSTDDKARQTEDEAHTVARRQ